MAKELKKHYSARELSAFCLQISLLLRAAIPLDEGLSVMAGMGTSIMDTEIIRKI